MKKPKLAAELDRARAWPKLVAPPTTVIADPKCSAAANRVALALSSFDTRGAGYCFPSAENLALRAHIERRAVFRGLRDLRAGGHTKSMWVEHRARTIKAEVLLWTKPGCRIAQFGPIQEIEDQIDHSNETENGPNRSPDGYPIDHPPIPDRSPADTGSITSSPIVELEVFKEDSNEVALPTEGVGERLHCDPEIEAGSDSPRPDPSGAGSPPDAEDAAAFFERMRAASRGPK